MSECLSQNPDSTLSMRFETVNPNDPVRDLRLYATPVGTEMVALILDYDVDSSVSTGGSLRVISEPNSRHVAPQTNM